MISSLFIPRFSSLRRGFSIVEVMFAIMVLGIGFIMVAAIFPVAIQQSQLNVDTATGRLVAISGAYQTVPLLQLGKADLGTGTNSQFWRGYQINNANHLQEMIQSQTVYAADPRYAWGGVVYADPSTSTLKVITVALKATNTQQAMMQTAYSGYSGYGWHAQYDNAFIPCQVTMSTPTGAPPRITFVGTNSPQAQDAAIEGAALIGVGGPLPAAAANAGKIFYLANPLGGATWELAGNSESAVGTFDMYLVGRGLQDPTAQWDPNANPRTGANQCLYVYKVSTGL
jgi:prepilin-type N-terminal cleavage/methylation domain-containing protein